MNKPLTNQQQPAQQVYRELVTINGKNVVLAHNEPPVINAGVLENGDIFRMINVFAEKFSPSNIDKADGTPLRLYTSDRVKVDVSKRRKHDMGFWHRNVDAHEIIFCVKGALEMGDRDGGEDHASRRHAVHPQGYRPSLHAVRGFERRQRPHRAQDRRRPHLCR